tara:strand:- start:120 stop:278 length:159 start_codon:yes stop_codon:yes gene_type:complete
MMLGLVVWDFEKGINHNLIRPDQKDFTSFESYWKELSNYLYLKYKDTRKNGD